MLCSVRVLLLRPYSSFYLCPVWLLASSVSSQRVVASPPLSSVFHCVPVLIFFVLISYQKIVSGISQLFFPGTHSAFLFLSFSRVAFCRPSDYCSWPLMVRHMSRAVHARRRLPLERFVIPLTESAIRLPFLPSGF